MHYFPVNVRRDSFPTVFRRTSYANVVVLENVTTGSLLNVPQFEAVDPDLRGALIYQVIGDGMAPVFFGLNENNKPYIVQPLTLAPQDQYKVRRKLPFKSLTCYLSLLWHILLNGIT